jgi:CRP-like cAMP-binding protein
VPRCETAVVENRSHCEKMRISDICSGHGRLLYSILEQSNVFRTLRSELLEGIVQVCDVVSLKKGGYLFREGDCSSGFYIVHCGAIRLYKLSSGGSQQVLKIFKINESFAESTVVSLSRYPANACADCPTVLARVDKLGIQRLAQSCDAIRQCLSGAIVRHLTQLVSHLEGRAFLNPESRVAKWILEEGGGVFVENPRSFEIISPKQSVADELDMASETFSRKLRSLREKGLINVSNKRIDIVNPVGLRELASEER